MTDLFGGHYHTICVLKSGKRSPVEDFTQFAAMVEAAKQYAHNDAVAYVVLCERTRERVVGLKHVVLMVGEAAVIDPPQDPGRRRGKVRSSPGTAPL